MAVLHILANGALFRDISVYCYGFLINRVAAGPKPKEKYSGFGVVNLRHYRDTGKSLMCLTALVMNAGKFSVVTSRVK